MPQSSRMMVTLPASRCQRATSGSPFAWSSAEEEDTNRRRRTRFFRQRQFFMRFFFSVQDVTCFFVGTALPVGSAVRTVYLPDPFPTEYPPPPPGGYLGVAYFSSALCGRSLRVTIF